MATIPRTTTIAATRSIDWMFLTVLLAHLPMGIQYCLRMWRQGHYQFFPLLMLVAGWLIYDRVSRLPVTTSRQPLTHRLLAINGAMLIVGTLLYSPLLWILSVLMLIAVYIYDRYGLNGLRSALPPWLLLLIIVPLPKGLDVTIINQMQFMASQLASWILDAFGQTHFREGVVLITEKKQFFTEEACSGIRSLFSSCAAIAIFGVINHYGILRHAFNLLQTIIWVIAGNAIRVALVVYVADNFYEPIATGPMHEMLGLVVFLFIFGLALSTDRAIYAWAETRHSDTDEAVYDAVLEGSLQPSVAVRPATNGPHGAASWLNWVFIGFFLLFAVFAGRLAYAEIGGNLMTYNELLDIKTTDLPDQIGGWTKTDFQHEVREGGGLLAPESFIWTYSNEGRQLKVSMDSPYYEFHNLKSCYAGLGWTLNYTHHYGDAPSTTSDFTWISMDKNGEYGSVIFSAFDRNGNRVLPNAMVDWKRRIQQSLQFATTSKKTLPVSQVQVMFTSEKPIDNREEIEQLFFQVRQRLVSSPRFSK